jgi:C1A family cysteine protease
MSNLFGYRPDPRHDKDGNDLVARDFDVKSLLTKVPQLSSGDVDLRPYCTSTSQKSLSACAGNATADAIEIQTTIAEYIRAAAEGRAPKTTPELARLFVYALARTLHGELAKDDGTYIRSCFEVLSRFGICTEADWPYNESKVFVSPSMLAQRKATGRKIHGYYRIKSTGSDRLTEIISALRSHHPVVFGTLVDAAFKAENGPKVVGPPTGATIGGHAMIVVGYIGGLFLVKNSWGTGWREGGFVFMKPEYLTWDETCDIWVPTTGYNLG